VSVPLLDPDSLRVCGGPLRAASDTQVIPGSGALALQQRCCIDDSEEESPMPTTTIMRRRAGAAAAGAVLASVTVLPPAGAADHHPVLENEHYMGTYTHVEQDIGECLDLPFRLQHDGTFNSRVQFRLRGSDPWGYASIRANGRDLFTNLETGETMTGSWSLRESDQTITDNGDGTITIESSLFSRTAYHAPSGALIGVDVWRTTGTWVIATQGTPDPEDDVVLSEEIEEPTGGARTLDGRDLCDLAAEYLS
jgi:hypothetical protein